MMSKDKEYILLKWGTLKGWDFDEEGEAFKYFKEYCALGTTMSAMAQRDTDEQKELICKMIDAANCDSIQNDWSGEMMTKDEAKDYVRSYGEATPSTNQVSNKEQL